MNESEYFSGVCAGLGWQPTPWRLAAFSEWHRMEGMPLETTWNPIATTRLSPNTPLNLGYDSGHGPGNWNSVPVRVYATPQAGINATVETLALDYYINIRRCFRDQTTYPEALPEFTTYIGSVAYGQSLLNFMSAITASKAEQGGLPVEDKARLDRLEKIVIANGYDGICRPGLEELFPAGTQVFPEGVDPPADYVKPRLTGENALKYAEKREFSLGLAIELK